MITGAQIRMARGYANLSTKALADLSGVSESTVKRMEKENGIPSASASNLAKVEDALKAQGIEFIPENGGGAGIRLIK